VIARISGFSGYQFGISKRNSQADMRNSLCCLFDSIKKRVCVAVMIKNDYCDTFGLKGKRKAEKVMLLCI